MYALSACDCCGSEELDLWPALVAPFIAEFVLDARPELCELAECRRCGFRFFDRRFDASEVERLYGNYRGDGYFAVRHHHEPWYTRRFNDAFAQDGRMIAERQAQLLSFVGACSSPLSLERVLDFGGDRGQLIPSQIGRNRRVVYDLSDAPPVAGVEKIVDPHLLEPGNFDLAILTGVLEHVSRPRELLREVATLVDRDRGVLFVQVPWERIALDLVPRGELYARYLRALARAPRLGRLVDLWSTACRVKLGVAPPLGFVKLHEHLNFFDDRSLRALLVASGLRVARCERGMVAGVDCLSAVAGFETD